MLESEVWTLAQATVSKARLMREALGMDEDFERWQSDGRALAEIGRALFPQRLVVRVRVPRDLVAQAIESWEREEPAHSLNHPGNESPEERQARHRSATLALIGCSANEGGELDGDDVVVELDAWFVGSALDAADEDGLLRDAPPPPR